MSTPIPATNPALAGCTTATEIYDLVTPHAQTQPHKRMVVGIGGSGKTLLLRSIRRRLQSTPIVVADQPDLDVAAGTVVLLDDAHLLDPEQLAAAIALATRDDISLIVATRPDPVNQGLADLERAIARRGHTVILDRLGRREIGRRARFALGQSLPQETTDRIATMTTGVLAAVDVAIDGLADLTVAELSDPERAAAAAWSRTSNWARQTIRHLDDEATEVLVIAMLGVQLSPVEISVVVGKPVDYVPALLNRVRCSGLLDDSGITLAVAREPLTDAVGQHRVRSAAHRVLATQIELGTMTAPAAIAMADYGIQDPDLSAFLATAADSVAAQEPATAATLYRYARATGRLDEAQTIRHAEAAARSGDFVTATQLIDGSWQGTAESDIPPAELARAARIACSIAAHQGLSVRSAELIRWLGADRMGMDAPIGAIVLMGDGDLAGAQEFLDVRPPGLQTALAAGWRAAAEGLAQTISGDHIAGLNRLHRAKHALAAIGPTDRILPYSVRGITAIANLHIGELARAKAVLATPVTDPLLVERHALFSAWATMIGGDLGTAAAEIDAVAPRVHRPRDQLLLRGLRVALARRIGDEGELMATWRNTADLATEAPANLFNILPATEIWMAAAQLGDVDRIMPMIDEMFDLLERLGDPPLWSSVAHWSGVQAAILSDNPASAISHAQALARAASQLRYAQVLATAGKTWVAALDGKPCRDDIEAAAAALGTIGHRWDGARLARDAAARCTDPSEANALMQVARSIWGAPNATSTDTVADAVMQLTAREAEVAELLVLGKPYREIGSTLFISAKTVEHHVARIRGRLGARSRPELMAMLRSMGYGAQPATDSVTV
ncbi:LuxR C-terminal-related transcriptional regulator [Jongsikchunia kroppenstedtii]|uniref:LuxR C-terminal-related transcriptional regulator n=1 Tax=Jongsikchunia kroppenstedtii TaxID=1121721 RepID=UPI0003641270|nr:LuxR C-terminal-related transcriptional regulator [Jongsikchunia kroppenstedtii]